MTARGNKGSVRGGHSQGLQADLPAEHTSIRTGGKGNGTNQQPGSCPAAKRDRQRDAETQRTLGNFTLRVK